MTLTPDEAAAKAEAAGGTILQAPTDKPHGLCETYILCENGYARVPSRLLAEPEAGLGPAPDREFTRPIPLYFCTFMIDFSKYGLFWP